jgi:hypothetical protein
MSIVIVAGAERFPTSSTAYTAIVFMMPGVKYMVNRRSTGRSSRPRTGRPSRTAISVSTWRLRQSPAAWSRPAALCVV